jgi:hypothetical protein
MAIIKNKSVQLGIDLPDAVLEYIAENITANVRQLEGAVQKLLALQSLMGDNYQRGLRLQGRHRRRTRSDGALPPLRLPYHRGGLQIFTVWRRRPCAASSATARRRLRGRWPCT